MQTTEISKRTLFVLLVLTIVISVAGTYMVMEAASDADFQVPAAERGKVSLFVREPDEDSQVSNTQGQVIFEITA